MEECLSDFYRDEAYRIVNIFSSQRHVNPYISIEEALNLFFPLLKLLRPDDIEMIPEEWYEEVATNKN